jgi:hypothetical protein
LGERENRHERRKGGRIRRKEKRERWRKKKRVRENKFKI